METMDSARIPDAGQNAPAAAIPDRFGGPEAPASTSG